MSLSWCFWWDLRNFLLDLSCQWYVNLCCFFNKGITGFSKFIKGLLMYIGGNDLNDHNENFSKTSKKCFISKLFPLSHSNYTLAFFKFLSKIYLVLFTQVVCKPQNIKLTFPLACDTLKSHFHQNITLSLKDFIPKSTYSKVPNCRGGSNKRGGRKFL